MTTKTQSLPPDRPRPQAFLELLGVREIGPKTSPFDPGYDPKTLESHLEQSAHLIDVLKISMAGWIIAREPATSAKLAAAQRYGIRTTTGGGPFEIAVAQGRFPEYLDLCAAFGFKRIECGEGFTDLAVAPKTAVEAAAERGLEVQFELGKKHAGAFGREVVDDLIDQGWLWLEAGACCLIIEARESAAGVGVFGDDGALNRELADRFADAFGLDTLTFEAPDKASQFALLDHFGPGVKLGNVRLEELLRVEIYRHGLHSDSFGQDSFRPVTADTA